MLHVKGNDRTSTTKSDYHDIGQKGAGSHAGTTTWTLHASACLNTLGISTGGGHHQLVSPDQSTVKASTVSASLHENVS